MAHPIARKPLDRPQLRDMALAYVGRYATTRAKLASYLGRKLPDLTPGIPQAIELMKSHRDATLGSAPLCQHDDTEASQTLSTAVYSCRLRSMAFSQGNPCTGQWQTCGMAS